MSKPIGTFEKALQAWTLVDLSSLQRQLDEDAVKVKENQESSLSSRKELASKTKEFKKYGDEAKLKELKTLLKQYQKEIDRLTERAKFAEGQFFQVYSSLSEVPDPKPLLEVSLDSVLVAEEYEGVKQRNQELEEQLVRFSDYEQLKERVLRNEQKNSEVLQLKLARQKDELERVFAEKESQWGVKQENYEKNIAELDKQVFELKTQQEVDLLKLQNQRAALDPDEQDGLVETVNRSLDQAKLGKQLQDLELENMSLQQRNEQLARELAASQSELTKQEQLQQTEQRLAELESKNMLLVSNFQRERDSFSSSQKSFDILSNNNRLEIESLKRDLAATKKKMEAQRDYDELKSEVAALKAIAFGDDVDEDKDSDTDKDKDKYSDDEDDEQDNVKVSGQTQLDEILVERNRKLSSELSELRVKHAALADRLAGLEKDLQQKDAEIGKLQQLNNELEQDLSDLNNGGAGGRFDTVSMISGVSKFTNNNYGSSSRSHGRKLSPASSIAGPASVAGSTILEETESSVLPIITSQRDRFRSRNIELELQIKSLNNNIRELKNEIGKLKKHNTELYERIRYLSTYNNEHVKFDKSDPERLYEVSYEESINPLTKFRQQEIQRMNSRLSPLEKIFLSFAKAILANKTSRMFFLFYCVGLHVLVMAMSFYVMNVYAAVAPDVGNNNNV